MDRKISIQKNIYSNSKFREVIDTTFSELTNITSKTTVEDFFNLYNELFLEIPYTGEFSHTTLSTLSQQILKPGGKDAKDNEIEALQAALKDLQQKLLTANQPDTSITREHPRFNNGSLVRRPVESVSWPDVFYMDQGFKRGVYFSGDPVMYSSFTKLLKYNGDTNQIPTVLDRVIDDIPSGEPLTIENFNDPFIPPKGAFEAEELRISIDPSDANLNPDKYNGDYDNYYEALNNDFTEKTNLIEALEEKILDFNTEIQKIIGG